MTDEAGTAEPLGAGSYDGRKSAVRVRPERGVEVQVRPVRRRNWPDGDKLRMVRETLQPGAVMLAAAVSGFVPVAVTPEVPRVAAPLREVVAETPGVIEIALPSGVTVRASGRVDMAVLRGVLAELGGR